MSNIPKILRGVLFLGADVEFGKNVVINVDEDIIIGDRAVIPDHAYFEGRRIEIGEDFFGYSWESRRLDVGRGRRSEEDAVLKVGARCTMHDNRIDLSRRVTIGDDVGLSPEVTVYTHYYWQSPLEGFPLRHNPIWIGGGSIIGYRSTILPGAAVARNCVIGAGSVVSGILSTANSVYAGNPAKFVRTVKPLSADEQFKIAHLLTDEYRKSCAYRGVEKWTPFVISTSNGAAQVVVQFGGCEFNLNALTMTGEEDEYTDDFRDFLFKNGLRFYTKRRFRRLEKR